MVKASHAIGPTRIVVAETDHDLIADFGDEDEAPVLTVQVAAPRVGGHDPDPGAFHALVLPEHLYLNAALLVRVGVGKNASHLRFGR